MKTAKIILPEQLQVLRQELDDLINRRETPYTANIDFSDYYALSKRKEELERIIKVEDRRNVSVGDGVTVCMYTDKHAYTVIKRTPTKLFLQRDKATLKKDYKPDIVECGFVRHVVNNEDQEYDYEPDTTAPIETANWSEKRGCFRYNDDPIINGRWEFYDYNF